MVLPRDIVQPGEEPEGGQHDREFDFFDSIASRSNPEFIQLIKSHSLRWRVNRLERTNRPPNNENLPQKVWSIYRDLETQLAGLTTSDIPHRFYQKYKSPKALGHEDQDSYKAVLEPEDLLLAIEIVVEKLIEKYAEYATQELREGHLDVRLEGNTGVLPLITANETLPQVDLLIEPYGASADRNNQSTATRYVIKLRVSDTTSNSLELALSRDLEEERQGKVKALVEFWESHNMTSIIEANLLRQSGLQYPKNDVLIEWPEFSRFSINDDALIEAFFNALPGAEPTEISPAIANQIRKTNGKSLSAVYVPTLDATLVGLVTGRSDKTYWISLFTTPENARKLLEERRQIAEKVLTHSLDALLPTGERDPVTIARDAFSRLTVSEVRKLNRVDGVNVYPDDRIFADFRAIIVELLMDKYASTLSPSVTPPEQS